MSTQVKPDKTSDDDRRGKAPEAGDTPEGLSGGLPDGFEARVRSQAGTIIYNVFGAVDLNYKPERPIVRQLAQLQDLITAALLVAHRSARCSGRCGGCGGPHLFDTSIPSPLWNAVIRANGLSDYLCTSCIIKAFVRARTGFTAELYGPEVNGEQVPRISVSVDEIPFEDSYGHLGMTKPFSEVRKELKREQQRPSD